MSQTRTYHSFFAKTRLQNAKSIVLWTAQNALFVFLNLIHLQIRGLSAMESGGGNDPWWATLPGVSWHVFAGFCGFGDRVEGRESAAIWYRVGPLPVISRVPITPIIGVLTLSYPFISGQFIEETMSLYLVTIGLGHRIQLLFCFVVGKLNQLLKIQETIELLGSPHFDPPSGNKFRPFFDSFLWVWGFNPSRKLRSFVKKNMETAAGNKKKT